MHVAGAATETHSFLATPAAIAETDAWMETVGARWSLSERCLHRARVCVAELAANVLEHGRANPTDRIEIQLSRLPSGIQMVFSTPGVPFNSATASPPDLNGDRIGGRGLRLVQSYASSINYRWLEGRNVVTLSLVESVP